MSSAAGDRPQGAKKHPCPDCRACQFCSDRRCDMCRGWLTGCCGDAKNEQKPVRKEDDAPSD